MSPAQSSSYSNSSDLDLMRGPCGGSGSQGKTIVCLVRDKVRSENCAGSRTLTAPPDGAVEHLDPAPPASPAFYRIAAP
jgi:hypothetical protein